MVTTEWNLVYGTGAGRDLHGDLYRPAEPNGAAVLMIHGGGWQSGSKDMITPQAEVLAELGFTCMACEYRLVGESAWPAQIHDVKAAMRWLRANAADLSVDPARIGVSGNSAGGHLALLLAGTVGDAEFEGVGGNPGVANDVAAVIAVYPCVGFYVGERTSGTNDATSILGENPDPAAAAKASPINHVSADFPPTFFLHGNGDKVVPVSASINMYNAITATGALAEMHIYSEEPHAWARWPAWVSPTMSEAGVFLERYLLTGHRYGEPQAPY
jgi:acetyl esterase/lipase